MRNNRRLVCAATLMGVLSGLSSTTFATGGDSAFSKQRQTLVHDGVERSYVIRVPRALMKRDALVPLVLVLHGGGGNAGNAERITGFSRKAEEDGFIVVYPEGTSRFKRKLRTWNAGHCCGYAMINQADDVGFIRELIDKISNEHPVDPKRIYATGMSNGGMMTHRLGIELSDRFAAIAPVVATLFGDEREPKTPVSAVMLNGMLDKSVPYRGGPPGGRFPRAWDGTPTKPALEQATFWADANDCTNEPNRDIRERFIVSRYLCPAGKAVDIYLMKDSGHTWPGGQQGSRLGDKPSSALNGTDVIWAFFKAHPKY